jgi:predicted secreted Zn-dependent protease
MGTVPIKPDPFQGFKPIPREPAGAAADTTPAPVAVAGPTVKYFDVQGDDVAALLRALDARGKHAESSWKLTYEYKSAPHGASCRVVSVNTSLQQGILLPRWSAPAGADRALVERWQRYVEELRRYEDSRLEPARTLEDALGRALIELEPAASCDALEAAARKHYETLVARTKAAEADFVARSKSGLIEVPLLR